MATTKINPPRLSTTSAPERPSVVFEHPRRWFELLLATVNGRAIGESTRDLSRSATLTIAAAIPAEPAPVLESFAVLQATPALCDRHGKSNAAWIEVYSGLVLADAGAEPDAMLSAVVAASALTGATNAVIAVWAMDPNQDFVAMCERALDQVDAIWPDASRKAPSAG